jgi:hypothetical protein
MTFPATTSVTTEAKPFAAHFSHPLPRGLRSRAEVLSWESFVGAYGSTVGPLRLGSWLCTDDHRRGIAGARTSTATACGPVAALTAMLYERGVAVEVSAFHQISAGDRTATFINGGDGYRTEWAMGFSEDSTQSALRAVIACANRLLCV